MNQNTNIYKDK